MKWRIVSILILLFFGMEITRISAQTSENVGSSSDNLVAYPFTDRTVYFNLSDIGDHKPITWGLDLAWLSESNIRRGINFMGANRVDIVRSSFMPIEPLLNGELQSCALFYKASPSLMPSKN